jgi:hypothetical protein
VAGFGSGFAEGEVGMPLRIKAGPFFFIIAEPSAFPGDSLGSLRSRRVVRIRRPDWRYGFLTWVLQRVRALH